MSIAAVLMMLTPPYVPPIGPISGSFQCLFEHADGPYSASFSFREDAPRTEIGPILGGRGEREASQAYFVQFPVDGSKIESVVFEADRTIAIYAEKGAIIGRLDFVERAARGDGQWMSFSSASSKGEFEIHGNCFGSITGRLERPVKITRIDTIRII